MLKTWVLLAFVLIPLCAKIAWQRCRKSDFLLPPHFFSKLFQSLSNALIFLPQQKIFGLEIRHSDRYEIYAYFLPDVWSSSSKKIFPFFIFYLQKSQEKSPWVLYLLWSNLVHCQDFAPQDEKWSEIVKTDYPSRSGKGAPMLLPLWSVMRNVSWSMSMSYLSKDAILCLSEWTHLEGFTRNLCAHCDQSH